MERQILDKEKGKSLFKENLWKNENKEGDGNKRKGYSKVINIFSKSLSKENKAKI